jgi:hypothetical protein
VKNFRKLDFSFDAEALMAALAVHRWIWTLDTFWKTYPMPIFHEVDTVYLRFPKKDVFLENKGGYDAMDCHNQPALLFLPQFDETIKRLVQFTCAERLGRVLVNRLAPGCRVLPHSDTGGTAPYYDRIHLVLRGADGVEFRCGEGFAEEVACMKTGEAWWFDNSKVHEVVNNSHSERVHLIVDVKTRKFNESATAQRIAA